MNHGLMSAFIVAAGILHAGANVFSQEAAVWDSIPAGDWTVGESPVWPAADAVMIFERILADERGMGEGECFLRVHRRIRLRRSAAKEWADVRINYEPKIQSVGGITGRTVHPDGTEIPLSAAEIYDREIVCVDESSLREKFFTMPGIADTCIVEYVYTLKSKTPNPIWVAQKTIPVAASEYRWQFFDPDLSGIHYLRDIIWLLFTGTTPNYLWVNSTQFLDIAMLPDENNPEEVVFRASYLSPYQSESMTVSQDALMAHLRLYYGGGEGYVEYWQKIANYVGQSVYRFIEESDDLDGVADSIKALPEGTDKIREAYDWVVRNIKRRPEGIDSRNEVEPNENVNDLLDRREGSPVDINYLYYSLIQKLGYKSFIASVSDRSSRVVYTVAKSWQFDGQVVGVHPTAGIKVVYHSPGEAEMFPGRIPWRYEGGMGFLITAKAGEKLFLDIPPSLAGSNARIRSVRVTIADDGSSTAVVSEILTGHHSRRYRLLLSDLPPSEHQRVLEEELSENLPADWRDRITGIGFVSSGDTGRLGYSITGPAPSFDDGSAVVRPLSWHPESGDPFVAEKRVHPIMFEYAETVVDSIYLIPPDGWTIEAPPEPHHLANKAGILDVRSKRTPDGLLIVAKTVLTEPIFAANLYGQVKEYYAGKLGVRNIDVVLKRVSATK